LAKKIELDGEELTAAARRYVSRRITQPGGWVEAGRGAIHKTLPVLLGLEKASILSVTLLLTRITILAVVACVPVLFRKLFFGKAEQGSAPLEVVGNTLLSMDGLDYTLAGIAIAAFFVPKALDQLATRKPPSARHLPYRDLAAAIQQMPELKGDGRGRDRSSQHAIEDALLSTLRALREEMADLVDDQARDRITDATLLEFCDSTGRQMRVRARTVSEEKIRRPVESFRMLAYYVALRGRPFVEHDFLHSGNPFPKHRLTVIGAPKVNYRSVLYLPIMWSVEEEVPLVDGKHGAPELRVVDNVMGVICVHCAKPYRFWRWGDHMKAGDGFGDVAYARALPYIALTTRLLESTAPKVKLESQ
jgi:hypothetical protein